ncbi:MAG TPA: T9SS type A sorting domain-containing protein [Ignavibacteria bacterium]|jgi:hypothetical protein
MKNKNLIIVTIIMTAGLVIPTAIKAQDNKTLPTEKIMYSTSNQMNDIASFTPVNPGETKMTDEKKKLLMQLEEARLSNDIIRKTMLEKQLDMINGSVPVSLVEDPNVVQIMGDSKPPFNNEHDYLTSTIIYNGGYWSSATQTVPQGAPNAGRIWVATTSASLNGTDTLKLFYSDNGGQSWTNWWNFFYNINMDFKKGELDMEVVYDGTVVWLFLTAGYDDLTNNRTNSMLIRINTSTNAYNSYSLNWPGSVTTNKYYNPRITSDNSFYTNNAYVYLACVLDSAYTGNGHALKQKYAHLTNPFVANPTVDYTQPTPSGGFFWSGSNFGTPYYYWSDIAYFRTQSSFNRILTLFNNELNNNFYLAWSDDFGASNTGNSVIIGTNFTNCVKMAFNGGANNYNGMITYIRQYSGNDWDVMCRSTTDGGQNWILSYVDGSTDRARSVDVIAPRGASNIFKIGYTQDSPAGPLGYYIGGNPSSLNQPIKTVITSSNVDTLFTKVIAGYKNGGGDDCLAIYSGGNGNSLYASRLCQSTVGITNNNNGIPSEYALMQNYPNPFNPTTNIKFSIPNNSFVNLIVYDITGKVVTTLVSQQLNAGNYTYDFNASYLSSGVYLYKLQADGFADVKKMMLIK